MNEPVKVLAQVGTKRVRDLNAAGVYTIGDLLTYSGGPVDGIKSMENMREKARKHMASLASKPAETKQEVSQESQNAMISSHSWRDVTIHFRDQRNHRIYRGIVRHLVVKSNVVGLLVEYPSANNPKNYVLQSPMLLFHLHQEWLGEGYVTDESDDEHTYPGGNDPPVMYMPPLLPDREELDAKFPPGTADRRSIDFYLREVNSLYAFHASID